MKILVCEHLTEKGHTNLLANVCNLLVRCGYEVIAVIPQNFTKELPLCKVERMSIKYYSDEYTQSSSVNKIKYCLRVQKYIKGLYKRNNIGVTFVITFDEIALAIGRILGNLKGDFFVIHNLNPDAILLSKYRRFAYKMIKNRVFSVVLAGFIKDILTSALNTDPGRILVLPHPMTPVENNSLADIDCVGISNSNDESIIEEIINREKKEGIFKKNNLKVILKSRCHKFDNNHLVIISGFIDSKIYDDFISRAKCIFIPFPESFKSRVSGTLIDALSNNKCVIGTNIPTIMHSSMCYKHVIKIFNESSFVTDIKEVGKVFPSKSEDFSRFHEMHSEVLLSNILNKAVNNVIEKRPMDNIYDF